MGDIQMLPDFLQMAEAIKDEIICLRRDIHQYPELGRKEFETSKKVEAYLRKLGITTLRTAETGVIGLLEGAISDRTVGLRADMDALALEEYSDTPYASKRPGIMHACGHDCHTAALLGTAKLLSSLRGQMPGNVKLFFQPDEEGDGGAQRMIDDGGMENPKVTAMFGAHVSVDLPAGKIGLRLGTMYAASNPFDITVKGCSCHGAHPHEGIDAVTIGAQIVTALQQYVSRQIDPLKPAVVSIGTFNSKGGQRNVISDEVKMSGIIRTLEPEMSHRAAETVSKIAEGVAKAMGAEAEIVIGEGNSAVVNDPAMTKLAGEAIRALLGEDSVVTMPNPSMGTEDFGIFLKHVPGTFYLAGIYNENKGTMFPVHNNRFCVDENALPILSAVHAGVAWHYLSCA
jgi:amidohydrolase